MLAIGAGNHFSCAVTATPTPMLWAVDVRRELVPACWELLSPSEQLRASNYIIDADRRTFIVTRAALRLALASVTGSDPVKFRFEYGRWGKPFVSEPTSSIPLHFSVSHSGWLSIIAVANGARVGIDVEKRRYVPEMLAIAKSCLGDGVAVLLARLKNDARDAAFLRFWTAAEAFAKASGLGWEGHGGRISLYASSPNGSDVTFAGYPTSSPRFEWSTRQLDAGPNHIGTLVFECAADEFVANRILKPSNLNVSLKEHWHVA